MGISLFWRGLNACPDGLGHLFTATTVILQIFSNWSQGAQPGPAPECPVECGWVGQILFGQCPNVGGVNAKGSSLSMSVRHTFGISILSASMRPHKASGRHCSDRHGGWHHGWHGGQHGGWHDGRHVDRQGGRHGCRHGGQPTTKQNNKKWPTWSWTWWPTWRKFSTRPLNNPFDFEQAFFFIIETFEKCEWTHRLKNVHFLEI